MIKLIQECSDIHKPFTAVEQIEMTIHSQATLEEMLDAYRSFLLACGYSVDGMLDVVNDE